MDLLVIDGNSLMNRAYYGIRLLTNKDGEYTNAMFGFLNTYLSLKNQYDPGAVVVAFDLKAPTFRHKIYPEYKAGRHATPQELIEQFPKIKELLKALGCFVIEKEGYEADDIIGTLAAAAGENDRCYIATGDRDALQLVSDRAVVLLATNKGHTLYDEEKIKEEYLVSPKQMIEIKALQGDSSDNIPGVAGIGPKTAISIISKYGNIDEVYKDVDTLDLSDGVKNKLKNGRDSAYLSREIGTICLEAPIEKEYSFYAEPSPETDFDEAARLLTKYELFKALEKLGLEKDENVQTADSVKDIVCAKADVEEIKEKLKSYSDIFVSFEYDGSAIVCAYFAFDNEVLFIECENLLFYDFLKSLLEDESKNLTVHDSKPIYRFALENGFECKNIKNDVMLGTYVLDPSLKSYEMSELVKKFKIPQFSCENEKALKVCYLKALYEYMTKRFKENGQEKLYRETELPLAEVLASMEFEGFAVDRQGIEDYSVKLDAAVKSLTQDIYDLVGYEFNVNSPKQLGQALFEDLGLKGGKKTKTGYSTNADVLEDIKYQHPVVELILRYRLFSKLKSTYCDGLLKVIWPDGRIRSTFNQTETRTGRLSSVEPNLQNIPVRTPEGKEFRKFFVAKEGCELVDADYSQIELRVLANMADDENMIEAFNEGKDFHTATAASVFNMPENMVTDVMRSRAKAVNFGIAYGIGAFSLAKDIGVTRKEAQRYIDGYLNHYHGVRDYMQNVIENAKNLGYAQTLMGRRRYLPELTDSNAMVRKFGERVAMNMPIQGTAADIIKIAMIKVYNRLKKEGMRSKLIMQVHDELIVEAPEDEVEKVREILVFEMENAMKMKVRLIAQAGVGKNWYIAKG